LILNLDLISTLSYYYNINKLLVSDRRPIELPLKTLLITFIAAYDNDGNKTKMVIQNIFDNHMGFTSTTQNSCDYQECSGLPFLFYQFGLPSLSYAAINVINDVFQMELDCSPVFPYNIEAILILFFILN